MFFGNFAERSKERVELPYPGVVTNVLVTYLYTDELDLDKMYSSDIEDDRNTINNDTPVITLTDNEVVLLIQLRDAANYLELSDLHRIISHEIGDSIAQKKEVQCVCAAMNELYNRGTSNDPLYEILLDIVRQVPNECFFPYSSPTTTNLVNERNKGVRGCSLGLLRELLENHLDSGIPPYCVARALQEWSQENMDVFGSDPSDKQSTDQKHLQDIAKTIKLKSIYSRDLANIKPCPLFSMEQLYMALVDQAKQPEASPPHSECTIKTHVRGAGVECANGTYIRQSGCFSPTYTRTSQYGGIESVFKISLVMGFWTISVTPLDSNHPHKNDLILYKARQGDDQPECPFGTWQCEDGTAPAPYVAALPLFNGSDSSLFPNFTPAGTEPPKPRRRRTVRARVPRR
jgi:hypothetical protein